MGPYFGPIRALEKGLLHCHKINEIYFSFMAGYFANVSHSRLHFVNRIAKCNIDNTNQLTKFGNKMHNVNIF